jgi:23S rRNA (guanosine2251-2'-O)-methyltransferase
MAKDIKFDIDARDGLKRGVDAYLAKLPMAGEVSSLNVSVATGVCLFEIVRQRRG